MPWNCWQLLQCTIFLLRTPPFCLLLSLTGVLSATVGYAEHCLVRIYLDSWDAIVFLRKRGQRRLIRRLHLFSDVKNGHNTWELMWPAEVNPPALKLCVVSVFDGLLDWLGWASASLGVSARASSLDRGGSELETALTHWWILSLGHYWVVLCLAGGSTRVSGLVLGVYLTLASSRGLVFLSTVVWTATASCPCPWSIALYHSRPSFISLFILSVAMATLLEQCSSDQVYGKGNSAGDPPWDSSSYSLTSASKNTGRG